MRNINVTLFDNIKDYLHWYDCYVPEIEGFLLNSEPFLARQEKAIKIIDEIMTLHRKRELLSYVTQLARIELNIRELEPWARDHVVHALLSFLLGIYLKEKFLVVAAADINNFQWKLAGLFHDVGYPVQIAKTSILKPFSDKINEIRKNLAVPGHDVSIRVVPEGLEKLTNGINGLDLIQKCLTRWGLKINAKTEYKQMVNSGQICHGMISALAVLMVIDLLYQKYNPKRKHTDILVDNASFNQEYFEKDVIPACSAIFVHNLPSRCFLKAKIDRSKAPLAFILKLSDCLQEWERPSLINPDGFPASLFELKIKDDRLILASDISTSVKSEIREEIQSVLFTEDVEII